MMFFLKDQMLGRKTSGNLSEMILKQSCIDEFQFEIHDASITSTSLPKNPGSEETSVDAEQLPVTNSLEPIRKKKKVESNFHQNFLDLEREKLELLRKDQSDETDDCRQFLLSLVPSMKNMTPRNQCMFRIKVQELVFQFLHGEDQHPQ
jgi:hypothetical protein